MIVCYGGIIEIIVRNDAGHCSIGWMIHRCFIDGLLEIRLYGLNGISSRLGR